MHPSMTCPYMTRRAWMRTASAAAFGAALAPRLSGSDAPTAPVAIAKCASYGAELPPTMARMFDQLGGLGKIVKNKTVAIKVNLTGGPELRFGHLPNERTYWTHPAVIGTTIRLMAQAGAKRIRILESPWATVEPLEHYMLAANWEPRDLLNAADHVEFENTNYLGNGKKLRAHDDAEGRAYVPRLRSEPLLFGLRCFRVHCEDEGTRHRGHHPLHEELLRYHALHHLWRWRGSGRAGAGSARRSRADPCRKSPTIEERSARKRSEIATRRWIPRAACRCGSCRRASHSPADYRRH